VTPTPVQANARLFNSGIIILY